MTTISVPEKLNDFEKKFNIRPIRKGDVLEKEAVVALVNRCYRSSENWCNESKIVQGVRISMSGLEESLRNSEVLIVEDQSTEKVVACVKTGVTNETVVGPMPEPTGYIGMFAVSPDYQSRGLGTHLMTAAERFCENKGMMKMSIDVLSVRNDIMKWYERCGYQKTGQSLDAGPFLEQKGEKLLIPCSFIVLQKSLRR